MLESFCVTSVLLPLSSCLGLSNVSTFHTAEEKSPPSGAEVHPERKSYKRVCMHKLHASLAALFQPLFDDPASSCVTSQVKFNVHRLSADLALLCNLSGSCYFPPIPFLCSANGLEQVLTTYKSFIVCMKDYLIGADLKINFTELCEFFDKIAYLEGRLFEQKLVPEMLKVRNDLVKVKGYSLEDAQLKARKEVYGFVYDQRPFPDDSNVATEFTHYRIGYYKYKLRFNEDNQVRRAGMGLLKTLCWVVDATLSSVPSWEWFYPFNYSPVLADIQGIADCTFQFTQDTPPTNLLHLLFVLPPSPSSQRLLPPPLQLQPHDTLPPKHKVEVDKMQFGEADAVKQIVVLPPAPAPLAEGVADLRQVLEAKRALLSPPELARDRRELCRLFRSSPCPQPPFLSPFDKHVFPDLNPCFTLVKQLPVDECEPVRPKEVSKHGKVSSANEGTGRQPAVAAAAAKEVANQNAQLVPPSLTSGGGGSGAMLGRPTNNPHNFVPPRPPPPNMAATPAAQIPSLRRNQAPYYQ